MEGDIPANDAVHGNAWRAWLMRTNEPLINKGFLTMIASQIFDTIGLSGKSDFLPVIGEHQYFLLLVNSSEYKEGEAAFGRGLTARNNPYSFLSPEYWRWQEGLLGNCQPRER